MHAGDFEITKIERKWCVELIWERKKERHRERGQVSTLQVNLRICDPPYACTQNYNITPYPRRGPPQIITIIKANQWKRKISQFISREREPEGRKTRTVLQPLRRELIKENAIFSTQVREKWKKKSRWKQINITRIRWMVGEHQNRENPRQEEHKKTTTHFIMTLK